MPTYQYACTACDERLEVVQSFTDAALTECPSCSGALRKVFSAVGVVFKGSGFYKNDSRDKPKATTSDSGPGESGKSEKASADASGPKTESAKPAATGGDSSKSSSGGTTTTTKPAAKTG